MKSIAIIGAGAAGTVAACNLNQLGYTTQVFDKSRGIGGRMATRRSDAGEFDHGARCFLAQTAEFAEALASAPVQVWPDAGGLHQDRCFVATPRQNQLAKHWLDTTATELDSRIVQLKHNSNGWQLVSDNGQTFGHFDAVILAIPAPQARELLENSAMVVPQALADVSMDPVWALMLTLEKRLPEAVYINPHPTLSWLGANFTKPGRPQQTDTFAYVAHATCQWSRAHLEDEAADAAEAMLKSLADCIADFSAPISVSAHRWRFALTQTPLGSSHLTLSNNLILAGDWCLGAEVEDAFNSGTQAALQLHKHLNQDSR